MRDDEDHPIVREYVRTDSILPLWLWIVLGAAAVIVAWVAF